MVKHFDFDVAEVNIVPLVQGSRYFWTKSKIGSLKILILSKPQLNLNTT